MGTVNRYSKRVSGAIKLAPNFTVSEFACQDGSDEVLIDEELPALLQKIRDHFGKPVTINSGYRSTAHNAAVGGVLGSQHTKGTAADIVVRGVSPLEVAQYAEYLMPDRGGIGVYRDFTHVDVRTSRGRWDNRSGREVGVAGWLGYTPPAKGPWYQEHVDWAKKQGITADGARPEEPATRAEVWAMLHEYDKNKKGGKEQ